MSKLITSSTIDAVREKAALSDVVGKVVVLSAPRAGKQKGLCPFHDERTPSFTVDDTKNLFYCFGCGVSGDAITFIQKFEHASFHQAVRGLAERFNVPFELTDGTVEDEVTYSRRQRLVEANRIAAAFFTDRLVDADAEPARQLLLDRGFDVQSSVMTFEVGFSPRGWDELVIHLRSKGFTDDEIVDAGLANTNDKGGVYDRFRGRLMWPIFNERGEHVGFGGRKLFQEENTGKYVNTSDTPIYKKSSTLYGLNLALKAIADKGEVIVVEGYTDVMAMHAAGIHNVIASSGTAFGSEHIRALRRVLAPQGRWTGRVVFSFDGDDAGRKAAVRAFTNTISEIAGHVFAVPAPDGLDACDLRLAEGNEALRNLFSSPIPLVQFVIDQSLAVHDVTSVQGRFDAAEDTRMILGQIPDALLQADYARYAAGRLGVETSALIPSGRKQVKERKELVEVSLRESLEFEALKVLVQRPEVGDWAESVEVKDFTTSMHRGAATIVLSAAAGDTQAMLAACTNDTGRDYITRLAMEPLEVSEGADVALYGTSVLARLLMASADDRIASLKTQLTSDDDGSVARELFAVTDYRKELLTFI